MYLILTGEHDIDCQIREGWIFFSFLDLLEERISIFMNSKVRLHVHVIFSSVLLARHLYQKWKTATKQK